MASRIINWGLADAHEASLQILLDFILYFVVVCYFFAYSISIFQSKVPKQHSRQCKSQFSCNGRTSKKRAIGLMYTIRLEKVANWQSPSCCFYFSKRRKQNSKRNGLPMTESH
jgi:hypothetical protein